MIHDPLNLFTVLTGVVLVSVLLDRRYKWAHNVSPVLLILVGAALSSNTGVITKASPLYNDVMDFTIPFAVCLVLFNVKLGDFKSTGLPLLAAFAIACIGSFVGVVVAGLALDTFLEPILGGDRWKLAGPFTGTYIGGSLNFIELWKGLGIEDPDLFGAANAVDNLTLLPLFALWIVLPRCLERFYPVAAAWRPTNQEQSVTDEQEQKGIEPVDAITLAFLALAIMVASELFKQHFLPNIPTILVVTTFALIFAQWKRVGELKGSMDMGNLSFYAFFAAVGATIDIERAIVLSPMLFMYVAVIIAFHFVFTYGLGRLMKMDIRAVTIASCAAKAGPPIVIALANTKGWKSLALPGMALGLLGYAIGNYAGYGTAYLIKLLLGL